MSNIRTYSETGPIGPCRDEGGRAFSKSARAAGLGETTAVRFGKGSGHRWSLNGLRRDDSGQALVGGTISLCLLSLVLLVFGITIFMTNKRPDVIMAARHAAWVDAMHRTAPNSATVRDHVRQAFFTEYDAGLFVANVPGMEDSDGAGGTGSSQIVTYGTRYGHDPFAGDLAEGGVPGVLTLLQTRIPLMSEGDAIRGAAGDPESFGRIIGFVDATCSWDRVGDTWQCPGDMLSGLYDMASGIIRSLL